MKASANHRYVASGYSAKAIANVANSAGYGWRLQLKSESAMSQPASCGAESVFSYVSAFSWRPKMSSAVAKQQASVSQLKTRWLQRSGSARRKCGNV